MFLNEEMRNECNHNLQLLNHTSALVFIMTEYILIELAHIYMACQNLCNPILSLSNMDINKCQGGWNSKVHKVLKSVSVLLKWFTKIQVLIFF